MHLHSVQPPGHPGRQTDEQHTPALMTHNKSHMMKLYSLSSIPLVPAGRGYHNPERQSLLRLSGDGCEDDVFSAIRKSVSGPLVSLTLNPVPVQGDSSYRAGAARAGVAVTLTAVAGTRRHVGWVDMSKRRYGDRFDRVEECSPTKVFGR